MARIIIDGYELESSVISGMRDMTFPSGIDGMHGKCMAASSVWAVAAYRLLTTYTEIYAAFLWRQTQNNSYSAPIFNIWANSGPGAVHIGGLYRPTGSPNQLFVTRDTTSLASSTNGVGLSSTKLIEIYFKLDNSAGRWVVKIDGATEIDFTGDTNPSGTYNNFDQIRLGNGRQNSFDQNNYCYWDDFILDSAAWVHGAMPSQIGLILPDGAGNYSQFTGDYTKVDNVPEDLAEFIKSNTVDHRSSFTMSGITGMESVNCIQASVRASALGDPTPKKIRPFLRIGGTDYEGGDTYGWWGRPKSGRKLWETNPATSSPFTPGEIDALEVGVRSVT